MDRNYNVINFFQNTYILRRPRAANFLLKQHLKTFYWTSGTKGLTNQSQQKKQ